MTTTSTTTTTARPEAARAVSPPARLPARVLAWIGLTLTIAKRELMSLFHSPVAYVVLILFALGASMIFVGQFGEGAPARLSPTLAWVVWLMIFLIPAISMRLISEEFRSGTIEPLMTAPISDTQVILGKWLGAMGLLAVLMLPLVAHWIVLEMEAAPDRGPIITGLVGMMLVGGLYLAIGTFTSATTQNQIIGFIGAVFIISLLTFGMYFLPEAGWVPLPLRQVMFYLNVNTQFDDFNRGLIDTSNFVYFISGIAIFLFLAVKVLESRRWR